MARVPTVTEPRQELNALPGNRQQIATPDGAFGATQARQLGQAGQALDRVADVAVKFQEEADKAAVLDFNTKAELLEQELTAGEGGYTRATPSGVFGPDADKSVPFTDRFAGQYRQRLTELRDSLASPRQKAKADELIATRATMFRGRVQAYEGKLIDDYNVEIGATSIKTSTDAIVAAYNDPAKIDMALAGIVAGAQQVGTGKRLGKEAVAAAALEAQSKALTAAVDRALDNGQHDLATNLLLKYGDRMTAVDKKALEKPVAEAARLSRGQEIGDAAVLQYTDEAEAVAAVRKAHAGADEEFFVKVVQQRFGEKQQAQQAMQQKLKSEAWSYVAQGQRPPMSVFRRLDGEEQARINARLDERASGVKPQTDWSRYNDLRDMARDDPQSFLELPLDGEPLAPAELKGLQGLRDRLAKGADKATEVVSMEQQIGASLNELNISGHPKKKGMFQAAAFAEITAEAKRLGREPNYDERQKILDRLALQEDGFFGGKRYYEVRDTEGAADFKVRIPDEDRAKIVAALKRANRPVSDAEVLRLYRLKHGLPAP